MIRQHWFIALFLFLLVFSVGLRFMSAGLLHYDSINLAERIDSNLANHEFKGLSAGGRYGMVAVVTAVYVPLSWFGYDVDFAIRLNGVLMLALSAVAMYFLAFEMTRSRMGGIGAGLLLVSTSFYIISASFGKEHSTALFFFVLACFAALRAHRSAWKGWSVVASVSVILAVAVREAWLIAVPVFVWFLLSPKLPATDGEPITFGRAWKAGAICFAVVTAAAFALFLGKSVFSVAADNSTGIAWKEFSLIRGVLHLAGATAYMLPFFIFGWYAVWRAGRRYAFPLAVWFALILYISNIIGYHVRYLDVVLVPFVLVVSFAIAWLYARWYIVGVGVLLFLVLTTFWTPLPLLEVRHNTNNPQEFSAYVASITPADSIIISMDESAFLRFYGNRAFRAFVPMAILAVGIMALNAYVLGQPMSPRHSSITR